MAKKGAMPNYSTIDDYIADQKEEAKPHLIQLRALINEVVPECKELLNYKVPSFTLVPKGKGEQQLMFAAYANFIGFYPFDKTMQVFAEKLKDYKQGKGSVQFPYKKQLPIDLIKSMVKYRRDEILEET
ncbi:MAG: DUF1801 domain-containing protein [Bacteroidia bacterium]